MTRRVLVLGLAVALAGCEVLAPVVGERSTHGSGRDLDCDLSVGCARLAEDPPPTFEEVTLAPSDDGRCGPERAMRSITLTESLTIDASTLDCVSLDVVVAPTVAAPTVAAPDDPAVTLTIAGAMLADARVHVTSSSVLAALVVSASYVAHTEIRVDGAVRVSFPGTRVDSSLLALGGSEPIDPPEVLFTHGAISDLHVTGPRAAIRFRDTQVAHSLLDTRSIAFERGVFTGALARAELVEALDVSITSARFDAARIIVSGGMMVGSFVERCDSLTLADMQVRDCRFAACAEPVDAQTVSLGGSVFLGDIGGADTLLSRSVIGGDRIDMLRGTLTNVALCGTSYLAATSLSCVLCEPASPSEVCVSSFGNAMRCPGICGATCATGASPASVEPELCAE